MSELKSKDIIGIAQINPQAGNLEFNAKKIIEYKNKADERNLDLLIFPELSLIGQPFGDLIKRHPFIAAENLKWLNAIAEITNSTALLIGFAEPDNNTPEKYNNSAALIKNGRIEKIIHESDGIQNFIINDIKYSVIIGNIEKTPFVSDSNVCINIFSMNSNPKKSYLYNNVLKNFAQKNKIPVLYINQAGAIDSWSFEGNSRAFGKNGNLFSSAKAFSEDFITLNPLEESGSISDNTELLNKFSAEQKEFSLDYEPDLERTYNTVIQGIKDYFSKCGLKRAVLGLSGGLDSTICAVLLADAIGKDNVLGISMPSKITTEGSKSDAKILAENLGIKFAESSIKELSEATMAHFNQLFKSVEQKWNGRYTESYTFDNIQARLRAMYLWGVSNEFSSCIPIATSDKSEAYMGYATVNGDMSGGFAPIADIPKTKLFEFAKWLNKNRSQKNAIPESIINKRPGAELAINPKTGKPLEAEEALMPYEFLDEIIWRIENKNESYDDFIKSTFLYEKKAEISQEQKLEWIEKFYRRMSFALYKWSIMPPSIIVESNSINGHDYFQPVTSGKICYRNKTIAEIRNLLQ